MTCWAASIAMLVNVRDGTTYTDEDIAAAAGIDVAAGADDSDYPRMLQQFGLYDVAGSCMTPQAWEDLLRHSPTIVGLTGHVVVASATHGDLHDTSNFHVYVLDPDPGRGESWWSFRRGAARLPRRRVH